MLDAWEEFDKRNKEYTKRLRKFVVTLPADKKYCGELMATQDEKKETILEEAARLVNGPRRAEYGHPRNNFEDVAAMWSIIIGVDGDLNRRLTADQVILMMVALKLCRGKTGYKRDTAVDIAGYAQCWELVNE